MVSFKKWTLLCVDVKKLLHGRVNILATCLWPYPVLSPLWWPSSCVGTPPCGTVVGVADPWPLGVGTSSRRRSWTFVSLTCRPPTTPARSSLTRSTTIKPCGTLMENMYMFRKWYDSVFLHYNLFLTVLIILTSSARLVLLASLFWRRPLVDVVGFGVGRYSPFLSADASNS